MSEIFASEKRTKPSLDGGHNFAAVGLMICFLAFSLSISTPWVMAEFQPPPSAEEDAGFSFSRWLYFELFGTPQAEDVNQIELSQDEEAVPRSEHWTRYWSLLIIAVAMVGLINSTIGVLQRQSKLLTISGISLGVLAITFQYIVIAMSILVVLVLLVFLLSAIGVDF
ncbi:MAG: hypothetical protein ACTHOO_04475 [Alcanivorax sp.]